MPVATKEYEERYLASFQELDSRTGSRVPAWLRRLRQEAAEYFAETGFPTTRNEEWKYTNVAPLLAVPFEPAAEGASLGEEALKPALLDDAEAARLVFVNGRFAETLSSLQGLPSGVVAGSLASALGEAGVEEHLGQIAAHREHPFAALNTAFLQDGAYLRVSKGTVLEKPVHLLFLSASGARPGVSHPRALVVAERDTQFRLVESYFGLPGRLPGGAHFSNAVTEILAGENAMLELVKLQEENAASFHTALLAVRQERGSNVFACSISLQGALVRNDVSAVLAAEGAECTLDGLYLAAGREHVDNHTAIDHASPHCASRQLYKGILDGHAAGVFNGKILVRKDAQKTNAVQSNKNLLLSGDAQINTKPQLEIFADDVRCTHGATIGQIDPEAVFYLRSRGIGPEEARRLLTRAFAAEILERVRVPGVRERVEQALRARWA